jgi:hypothetical protein
VDRRGEISLKGEQNSQWQFLLARSDAPPARKRAHKSHTGAEEIKIYWGFARVLLT